MKLLSKDMLRVEFTALYNVEPSWIYKLILSVYIYLEKHLHIFEQLNEEAVRLTNFYERFCMSYSEYTREGTGLRAMAVKKNAKLDLIVLYINILTSYRGLINNRLLFPLRSLYYRKILLFQEMIQCLDDENMCEHLTSEENARNWIKELDSNTIDQALTAIRKYNVDVDIKKLLTLGNVNKDIVITFSMLDGLFLSRTVQKNDFALPLAKHVECFITNHPQLLLGNTPKDNLTMLVSTLEVIRKQYKYKRFFPYTTYMKSGLDKLLSQLKAERKNIIALKEHDTKNYSDYCQLETEINSQISSIKKLKQDPLLNDAKLL